MFGYVLSLSTAIGVVAVAVASVAPQRVILAPMAQVSQRYNPEQCNLPPVPKEARLVAFSVYEGEAVSSAVIGNQDVETNLIDVTIEPGSEPLYLVLTSYESMIWRVSGATNRVTRVVVSSSEGDADTRAAGNSRQTEATGWGLSRGTNLASQRPRSGLKPTSLSGVLGLPRSKVTIAKVHCPSYAYKTQGVEADRFSASIIRHLGRTPDLTYGDYSPSSVSLPSGFIAKTEAANWVPGAGATSSVATMPKGFDPAIWREAVRYWPRGLVHVDPSKVVAAAQVQQYLVLPSQMGLSQLVGAGAIQRQGDGTFRVVRSIPHMPPSMGGAHSAVLIFAKGVAVPPGKPGHSCIVEEATGSRRGAICDIGRR